MVWTFLIQSNSRAGRVKNLLKSIDSLKLFNREIKIIISDNGNQGKNSFICGDIIFEYIDNSKYNDGASHSHQLLSMDIKNFFYIHDDDQLNINYLLKAMDFIEETNLIFLVSPKLNIPKMINFNSLNKIFEFYFLSPSNNCPLFSGIFISDSNILKKNKFLENLISGKYADVQFVSRLLLCENSYLFNLSYLNYIEHDTNDNKTRNLYDRIQLSQFIRSNSGFSNLVISLLIFHGYKEKFKFFMLGLILGIFYPPTAYKIFNKSIKKYIL
jgi:hypothetical protein